MAEAYILMRAVCVILQEWNVRNEINLSLDCYMLSLSSHYFMTIANMSEETEFSSESKKKVTLPFFK